MTMTLVHAEHRTAQGSLWGYSSAYGSMAMTLRRNAANLTGLVLICVSRERRDPAFGAFPLPATLLVRFWDFKVAEAGGGEGFEAADLSDDFFTRCFRGT